MITHVHIMSILRVRISLPPIVSILRIMVCRRLAQKKSTLYGRDAIFIHRHVTNFLHSYIAGLNVMCRNC